jgi:acetyl esterase/lipase
MLAAVALVAFAFVATGCLQFRVPSGRAPLRYRDAVFTGVTKTPNVTYGSAVDAGGDTVTLKLDVYEPTGDAVDQRPAIVWVHGGSFCCGSKTSPEIVDEANTFARKGYFNIAINYRLEPGGCSAGGVTQTCITAIREALADTQTAVRWLRSNASTYRIDTNRIAVAGTSAGAITALNVAYSGNDPGAPARSKVRAAVSLSGSRVFGRQDANDPPVFLLHGTNDGLVPYDGAVNTVEGARAAGAQAYLTTWEGHGHVPYASFRQEILDQTRNFLYAAMNLANAAR